jgi:Fe-S-cluster-containing dehydrogenase component
MSRPEIPLTRRDALTILGLGGLAAVTGKWVTDSQLFPAQTKPETEAPERAGKHRWVMVISMETCTGCDQCTYACQASKNTPDTILWNVISHEYTSKGWEYHIARPCLHCENPPCTDVCPVGATYRREVDGLVVMDYDKCIGCRYCMVACPYGARSFNWEDPKDLPRSYIPEWGDPEVPMRPRGVVEKCTFCIERMNRAIAEGLTPGEDFEVTPPCVTACPAEARFFGDLNDPDSQVSQLLRENSAIRLREDLGTNPRVYYILPEGGL